MKLIYLILILINIIHIQLVYGDELSVQGLHVVGRFIKNKDNKVIQLRGANRPGTEYCCVQYGKIFDGPFDSDHIKDMKSWNINAVRVPLNEDCWLGLHAPESDHFGAEYRKAITAYVNDITSNNIAVIIDLHWSGDKGGTVLAERQIPMPNKVNSPRFWQSVANTFKSNSAVVFDLYNEPYPYGNDWDSDNAWECWKEGKNCGAEITYDAAGMQDLILAVRSTGSKNIVILSGIQYATSLTKFLTFLPTDPIQQMGAALHSYDFNYCRSRGCWDTYLRPVFEKLPIVATETGQKDCHTDFIRDFLHYADQNDIHYLAWSWLVAPCDNPSLIQDYDGTPSNYGKGLKLHLNALASDQEPYYTDTFDMYNDKMTHWVDDWSSATHTINDTTVVEQGKYSIFYQPDKGKTIHFMCWGCIQTNVHKSIEFWVNGGTVGGQDMDVDLLHLNADQTNTIVQTYKLQALLGQPVPAGKWVKVSIDLTQLPADTRYDGMWLKPDSNQPSMYLDQVTVRAKIDPPVPAGWEDTSSSSSSSKLFISFISFILSFLLLLN